MKILTPLKLAISLLVIIIAAQLIYNAFYNFQIPLRYGVSFSPRYARYLNLDWQKVYIQILDDLKVKNLRIPTYWTSMQPEIDKFDFQETDFMTSEAEKRGARVILVVGVRQPRWPECHVPNWAKNLSTKERQAKILQFVQKTVERYKANKSIWAYQVENEPFVGWFGENCDPVDKNFFQQELNLVRKLDSKPIVITDSGEWSLWTEAKKLSDILGISLYRKAYNSLFGYINYPFPPVFYQLKSSNKKTIIAELQSEPWVQKAVTDTPLEQQIKLFSLADFQSNINYAQKTGFDEAYFWGVEWWYWMAENGYPQYLDFAKPLF